ncbi:MAG: histidine phosphatase family protein [Methylophilaceae bacterium]
MTKSIYFIRHGESTANAGGKTVEHQAIPLSEKGLQQAQLIAETLNIKPSIVLVSELVRTKHTAQPFCEKHQIVAQVEPLLNEFSIISYELIAGMSGKERRPLADAFWLDADVNKRMGKDADTFLEFDARVSGLISRLDNLPHNTVIFGHGIWFGLFLWKLLGFDTTSSSSMRQFRTFQSGLPLQNCITYKLHSRLDKPWNIQVQREILEKLNK